jgi:hypothetical protein
LNCNKCANKCADCINNAAVCSSCIDSLHVNPPSCTCKIGMFDDLTTCKNCNQLKCSSCLINENNCIICNYPRVEAPDCECPKNYYEEDTTEICVKCSEKYQNCSRCDKSKCSECSDSFLLYKESCIPYATPPRNYHNLILADYNPCLK